MHWPNHLHIRREQLISSTPGFWQRRLVFAIVPFKRIIELSFNITLFVKTCNSISYVLGSCGENCTSCHYETSCLRDNHCHWLSEIGCLVIPWKGKILDMQFHSIFKLRQRSFYNPKCRSVGCSVSWFVCGIFF